MLKQTYLHDEQRSQGARMVPFAGWEMPLHFGSQLDEHKLVRRSSGLFDVSHMGIVEISGTDSQIFLQYLLANDVAKLTKEGKALYSCMLNPAGGILDDLIVYLLGPDRYRLIINAATKESDLHWMRQQAQAYSLKIKTRDDLAMLALQGPKAEEILGPLLMDSCKFQLAQLKPFTAIQCLELFIARTGYTGEDGFEILLPHKAALDLWKGLIKAGVQPCGLGARDSLRLEAGLNLYGTDMDESISPLESGLGWTLAMNSDSRDFIGKKALLALAQESKLRRFTGLVLESKGVLRNTMQLYQGDKGVGVITSGGFSPSLDRSIALARIDHDSREGLEVDIRGKRLGVREVKLPFVRKGKILIEL